jgi:cytolysin-activating lysine-acyltransferase
MSDKITAKSKSNGATANPPALADPALDGPAGATVDSAPTITPELAAKIDAIRTKIQLSVGQVVLAIMDLPRYRHQTLADLMHVVLDPLMRDRVAIAYTQPKGAPEGSEPSVAGIAIWASVSDAVDTKLTEQVRAGVFPVRLSNEDWVSGETIWLLDVIAADKKQATSVLANFKQLSGDKPVKVHPIVARSVEAGVLDRMRVQTGRGANPANVAGDDSA